MKASTKQIEAWAKGLTKKQLQKLIIEMTEELITSEMISFHHTSLAPSWHHSGDPLVEGQKTYPDEDN